MGSRRLLRNRNARPGEREVRTVWEEGAAMRYGLALLIVCMLSAAAAAADHPPVGRWLTASGNVVVEIAPCGDRLCGKVVEIRANRSMEDSSKQVSMPPRLGMAILYDLVPTDDGEWQGHIFNRENGKTYDCLISSAGAGELKVRAYVFVSLIGRTQIWKKV